MSPNPRSYVVTLLCALALAASPRNAVPDELLLKFKKSTSTFQRANIVANLHATRNGEFESIGWEHLELNGMTVDQALAKYRNNPNIESIEARREREETCLAGHDLAAFRSFIDQTPLPKEVGIRLLSSNPIGRQDLRLELAMPKSARVDLRVFDVRGSLVRRVVSRSLAPGYHQVAWNGRNESGSPVGSGIYFVRMRAGERVITERVAVVR